MFNMAKAIGDYTWSFVPESFKTQVKSSVISFLQETAVAAVQPPKEEKIPDTDITASLAIREVQDGIDTILREKQIPLKSLNKMDQMLDLMLREQARFGLEEEEIEQLRVLKNLLLSFIPRDEEETALVVRSHVIDSNPIIRCEETAPLVTYKSLFAQLRKKYQQLVQSKDTLSPVIQALRDRTFGQSNPILASLSQRASDLSHHLFEYYSLIEERSASSLELTRHRRASNEPTISQIKAALIREIGTLLETIDAFSENAFSSTNPYELTSSVQSSFQGQMTVLREFLIAYRFQLSGEPINSREIPTISAKVSIDRIPPLGDTVQRALIELQNSIISPLRQLEARGGVLHQLTEGGISQLSAALDSNTPLAKVGKAALHYLAPQEEEQKRKRGVEDFLSGEEAPPVSSAAGVQIPTVFSLVAPFFEPFLQAFSADGGGFWGGLCATAAYPAVAILKSMIKNLIKRGEQASSAMQAVEQAKSIIEKTIHGKNQSLAAYQEAFSQAWNLCTQFPILLEGFELPSGLKTEKKEAPPLQQLQEMAKSFRENHAYLDIPSIKPAQTDARIDRIAQTGACFGTYQLCAWGLGSSKDFPSFHEIIIETKAMNEEERKEFFLQKLGEAIDADVTSNVIVRWVIRIFLPLIYWFSTLFSHNLGHGLKHYFREVVIPSIKKDANKRLHSASISGIGHCLDDLNKMMTDFIRNPQGSGWNLREHIRQVKDDKIYNGERAADELYDEFGDICVEEIMPKLAWSEQVGEWESDLGRWIQEDDHMAVKILKEALIFPVRCIYWIFRYVFVAPTQWVMQAFATWGAKKAFVDTKAVKNIMQNVKTTRFEETPYVPVLDVLARWLEDIRQAQIRGGSIDPASYRSDPENQKTIKEFLDRAFRFVEMWNTDSREQLQKLLNGPSGLMGAVQEIAEGALLPPIQNALVGLIELVQSIATEETQLERFLFEFCEIAENALTDAGRELSPKENKQREKDYQDIKKLIECTLNAILWTVCTDATADLMKSNTVETAKQHLYSIKKIFLGSSIEFPRSRVTSAINFETFNDEDTGGRVVDDPGVQDLIGTLETIHIEEQIESSTLSDKSSLPPPNNSEPSELATDEGIITDWKEALSKFGDNPNLYAHTLQQAYTNCFRLTRTLEQNEVKLNIGPEGASKVGSVTRQQLDERTSPILKALQDVYQEFHLLYRLHLYHGYRKKDINPAALAKECIDCVEVILTTRFADASSLLLMLEKKQRALSALPNLPIPIANIAEKIEQISHVLADEEGQYDSLVEELRDFRRTLDEELETAKQLFKPCSKQTVVTPLQERIAGIQNKLTSLKTAVEEATYVEFLEIDIPAPMKALGHLALSSLQERLYIEMSSRAKIFIDALCNGDVFELLIRNMAIRPLVESMRGERKPSYTKG